jgi:hypothetical protein
MKYFWLNDALTIQAEDSDERNALKVLLEGVLMPNRSEEVVEHGIPGETQISISA